MPIKGLIFIALLVVICAFYFREDIYDWLRDEEAEDERSEEEKEK